MSGSVRVKTTAAGSRIQQAKLDRHESQVFTFSVPSGCREKLRGGSGQAWLGVVSIGLPAAVLMLVAMAW